MADISVTADHFFLWADWIGLERTWKSFPEGLDYLAHP